MRACPTAWWRPTGDWLCFMEEMNRVLEGQCQKILVTGGNGPGKTVFLINALVLPLMLPNGGKLNPYIRRWPVIQQKDKYIRYNGPEPGTHSIALYMPTGALETTFFQKLSFWAPKNSYTTHNAGGTQKRTVSFHGGGQMYLLSPKQDLTEQAGFEADLALVSEPLDPAMLGEIEGRLRGKGFIWMENCPDYNKHAADLVQIIDMMEPEDKLHYPIHKASTCFEHEWNGFRRHIVTEKEIRNLKSSNPASVPARVAGISSHYAGKLFQQWNDDIHIISDEEAISRIRTHGATVWCGIDPHDNKPFVMSWVAVTGNMEGIIIDEWPRWQRASRSVNSRDWFQNAIAPDPFPFHMMKMDWADDIQRICQVIHTVESNLMQRLTGGVDDNGFPLWDKVNPVVQNHYIDPRPANTGRKIAKGKSILKEMRKFGSQYKLVFSACKQEGNLDWRHKTIRGLLSGEVLIDDDDIRRGKTVNLKKMFVAARCQNSAYAFKEIAYLPVMRYNRKIEDDDEFLTKLDEKTKHWIDSFAYVMQRNPVHSPPKSVRDKQVLDPFPAAREFTLDYIENQNRGHGIAAY